MHDDHDNQQQNDTGHLENKCPFLTVKALLRIPCFSGHRITLLPQTVVPVTVRLGDLLAISGRIAMEREKYNTNLRYILKSLLILFRYVNRLPTE